MTIKKGSFRIWQLKQNASLFNDDLSNEPNGLMDMFFQVFFGYYLLDSGFTALLRGIEGREERLPCLVITT
jgi:hypothetical protein